MKLLRIIALFACEVDNLHTNFGVLGRFVLNLWANTSQTRHVTLRPRPLILEVTRLSLMRVFVLRLCTKFEVGLPIRKKLGIYCVNVRSHTLVRPRGTP